MYLLNHVHVLFLSTMKITTNKFHLPLIILFVFLGLSGKSLSSPNGTISSSIGDTLCADPSTGGVLTLSGYSGSIQNWWVSTNAGVNWLPVVGSNGQASITFFAIMSPTCYMVTLNGGADTSQIFCFTVVTPGAAQVTGAPNNVNCGPTSGTLTATNYSPTVIGWYSSTNNGASYTALGSTSPSYNFTNVNQTTIFAFITKTGGCPADTARDTVKVDPLSDAGVFTGAINGCGSVNGTLIASNIVGNVLAWYTSPDSATWTPMAVGNPANQQNINITVATYYQIIVQSGICPADTGTIKVLIGAPPTAGTLSGANSVCATSASGTINFTGGTGSSFNLISSINSGSTWTNVTNIGSSYNYNVTQTTLYAVISNGAGCPNDTSNYVLIEVNPPSNAGTINATQDTICSQNSMTVFNITGYTGNQFQWQVSIDGGATFANVGGNVPVYGLINPPVSGPIIIRVNVTANPCPTATSGNFILTVIPSPTVSIVNNDTTIPFGTSTVLTALGSGTPAWTPIATLTPANQYTTTVTPVLPTTYTITVTDPLTGCTGSDSVRVRIVLEKFMGQIANFLTPNNDGFNDEWWIENIDLYESSEVHIFNEYGQEIYKASPYMNDWKGTYNGTRIPDGTYFYTLKVGKDPNTYRGNITLMSQK